MALFDSEELMPNLIFNIQIWMKTFGEKIHFIYDILTFISWPNLRKFSSLRMNGIKLEKVLLTQESGTTPTTLFINPPQRLFSLSTWWKALASRGIYSASFPKHQQGTELHFYRPQTKLRKGNIFPSVCQEFYPRGVYPPGQTHPWADTPPPKADGYCSGRYASYWNAFLFVLCLW